MRRARSSRAAGSVLSPPVALTVLFVALTVLSVALTVLFMALNVLFKTVTVLFMVLTVLFLALTVLFGRCGAPGPAARPGASCQKKESS